MLPRKVGRRPVRRNDNFNRRDRGSPRCAGEVAILSIQQWSELLTVWIYDQGKELKELATEEAAKVWLDENDPVDVAFAYDVIGLPAE